MNVRGVLRQEGSVTRRYIVKVAPSDLEATVSPTAMRLSLGLSSVAGDVVLPAPAGRVSESPLDGMALRTDDGGLIGAFRVLLLVRGTQGTKCDPIDRSRHSKSHPRVRFACSATQRPVWTWWGTATSSG